MHARGLVHLAGVRSFVPPSLASRRPAPRAAMESASSTPARSDPGGPQRTIVSADWLRANLARVKVLDCSWYLPAMNRDAVAEFRARRLPGARYFDVDLVSDRASPLPHMLPSAAAFAAACDALGVANDDQIVVYDGAGLFSAARAWWMFKTFGHDAVAVLDGGAPAWDRAGGEWDETPSRRRRRRVRSRRRRRRRAREPRPRRRRKRIKSRSAAASYKYSASLNPALVRSKAEVLANCVEQPSNNPERLVDARPEPRWRGRARSRARDPERPRPGKRQRALSRPSRSRTQDARRPRGDQEEVRGSGRGYRRGGRGRRGLGRGDGLGLGWWRRLARSNPDRRELRHGSDRVRPLAGDRRGRAGEVGKSPRGGVRWELDGVGGGGLGVPGGEGRGMISGIL